MTKNEEPFEIRTGAKRSYDGQDTGSKKLENSRGETLTWKGIKLYRKKIRESADRNPARLMISPFQQETKANPSSLDAFTRSTEHAGAQPSSLQVPGGPPNSFLLLFTCLCPACRVSPSTAKNARTNWPREGRLQVRPSSCALKHI